MSFCTTHHQHYVGHNQRHLLKGYTSQFSLWEKLECTLCEQLVDIPGARETVNIKMV